MERALGPRSGQIYRDLRQQIETGHLAPGASLPSQAALAREYGVAVMTVRQALERLEAEGYVRAEVGSGTYVEANAGTGARTPAALRAMVAAAPVPIIALDRAGTVTAWNPAAESLFGWSASEVLNRPSPVVSEEMQQEFRTLVQETLDGRTLRDVEVICLRRDGTPLHLNLSAGPLTDDDGVVIGSVASFVDLTERREAQEALQGSEARFRGIAESALEAIVVADSSGSIVSWNRSAERMFGYTEEEARGLSVESLVPARFRDEHNAGFHRFMHTGEPQILGTLRDGEGLRKDGTELPIEYALSSWSVGDERFVSAIIRDVSDRRRAQEAFRESQERFESAFDFAAIGMALVGLDGRWLHVNRALCDLVGYTREEMLVRTFQDITDPRDLDADLACTERMLAREIRTYQMEKRYIRKDKRVVWALLSVSLVHAADGAPLYFIAQIQDITERKRAEESLRQSESRFRTLIQGSPIGVCVTNRLGVLEQVNSSFADLFGYSIDELEGQHHSILFSRDQVEHLAHLRRERFALRTGATDEVELLCRDGTPITVLSTSVPIDGPDSEPLRAAFVVDISERKRVAEAIEASERQLRTLIEKGPIGICVIAQDGIFEQVNDAYAAMLGYTADGLVGRHYSVVMPEETRAAGDEHVPVEDRVGEYELVHREGTRVAVLTKSFSFDPQNPERRATFVLDITEQKRAQEALQFQATHDALTGLANRLLLQDRIGQAVVHAKRYGEVVALLFIDLDGLKQVNDGFGHSHGDELLMEISRRLTEYVGTSGTVARLSGDEFVLVLPDVGSAVNAARIAAGVLQVIGEPFEADGQVLSTTAAIGISLYPFDGDSARVLMQAADESMYRAKRQGSDTYAFYNPEMAVQADHVRITAGTDPIENRV